MEIMRELVAKDKDNGWSAESDIKVKDLDHGEMLILRATTYKNRTTVQAGIAAYLSSSGLASFSFDIFGDYKANIPNKMMRATKKAVVKAHLKAIEEIESKILQEALEHYEQE